MQGCDPSFFGIILRLVVAILLISYGILKSNIIVILIGIVPIARLNYHFYFVLFPS